MMVATPPPLTWLDIARSLAAVESGESPFPAAITAARVGWYGLLFEADTEVELDEIANALETLFPSRIKRDPLRIELDMGDDISVDLEINTDPPVNHQPFGVIDGVVNFRAPQTIPTATVRKVPVAAALSVKGGTGRTTTAIAFALHWAKSTNRPILLVDADLEAPGISYLFEEKVGKPKVSLEDLIVLAHAEEAEGAPTSTRFVAERLRDHRLGEDIYILPLRREIDELASSSIRPEHLSTPSHPFALADLLSKVAEHLGAAGVVVDVRAGLVPIGVNLAMDPDVAPIIVTSLAQQSIRATANFSKFLAREFRRARATPRRPLLVVNRVPLIFRQTGIDKTVTEPLTDSLYDWLIADVTREVEPGEDVYATNPEVKPFFQVEVPELSELQVTTGGWDGFVEQLRDSGFLRALAESSKEFILTELSLKAAVSIDSSVSQITVQEKLELLRKFAEQLIAAENADGIPPRPLVTQPLNALASRYKSEVPIAISEGAKGTGKTLAARFIVSKGNWNAVVGDLIGERDAVAAWVVPITASIQSSEPFLQEVDRAREATSKGLELETPLTIYDSTSYLKDKIGKNLSENAWVSVWLDIIAWSAGFKPNTPGAGGELFEALRARGASIVALFEGLEELYASASDSGVATAMRALLVSLPQKLRSEPRRPIGLVTLVRRDTVEAAIPQNLDQFRRDYASFALTWTDDDVLELAAWLATQSGALPDLWNDRFHDLSTADRSAKLVPLWGTKLAPDDTPDRRSREAYTANWIIAVLSDLRGRLVPRDLVRLLAGAAATAIGEEEIAAYDTRLLIPRALREAIDPTSRAKVDETVEEIGELKSAFDKFKAQADELTVPLDENTITRLDISPPEVAALIRHGIIFGDKPPYEVPELFRRGLGLRHSGARYSVINLYKRARRQS